MNRVERPIELDGRHLTLEALRLFPMVLLSVRPLKLASASYDAANLSNR